MKTELILLIVAVFISSAVRVQADETFPDVTWRVQMYDFSAGTTMTKGSEFLKRGDCEKARQYYEAAIARDPKEWPPHIARAAALQCQRQWALAAQELSTVLQLKPTLYLAAILRGWMNERLGNYSRSLADYDRILSFRPAPYTRAFALNSRAWLRATCPDASFRNAQQAMADAKAACRMTSWSKPDHIDTLAAAYAEAGDFDSAVRFEQKALAGEHEEVNRKRYEYRLTLYQTRHPFRDEEAKRGNREVKS